MSVEQKVLSDLKNECDFHACRVTEYYYYCCRKLVIYPLPNIENLIKSIDMSGYDPKTIAGAWMQLTVKSDNNKLAGKYAHDIANVLGITPHSVYRVYKEKIKSLKII